MNITVYCGASTGNLPVYKESAISLGEWIASRGDTLIYGGGKVGLMGILADTTLDNGSSVIGIIPEFLMNRELAHTNLTELQIVESMSERKIRMASISNAFIALPGGPGTLEEITEMISWSRIGKNPNPCIFFNANNFYDSVKKCYDDMVLNQFLTLEDRNKILFSDSLTEISQFIDNYQPPIPRKY